MLGYYLLSEHWVSHTQLYPGLNIIIVQIILSQNRHVPQNPSILFNKGNLKSLCSRETQVHFNYATTQGSEVLVYSCPCAIYKDNVERVHWQMVALSYPRVHITWKFKYKIRIPWCKS